VPATPAETIAERVRPLVEAPARAAILADVDGTLAPIVDRADMARVPRETARLLGDLARRYGAVACISGRPAAEARRLVGVGGIVYAGTHGAEVLEPGSAKATFIPALETFRAEVAEFAASQHGADLKALRVSLEDKGPIVAFHWRGASDEDVARARLEEVAQAAEDAGLAVHWGRKVLEIRPPVPISKGRAVREIVERAQARTALFAGDDVTDLDAFDALDALESEGLLDVAVRVGVRTDDGPPAIVERADLVVGGPDGVVAVLEALVPPRTAV
jgi:trehalose 6-phosphate phosphatase